MSAVPAEKTIFIDIPLPNMDAYDALLEEVLR